MCVFFFFFFNFIYIQPENLLETRAIWTAFYLSILSMSLRMYVSLFHFHFHCGNQTTKCNQTTSECWNFSQCHSFSNRINSGRTAPPTTKWGEQHFLNANEINERAMSNCKEYGQFKQYVYAKVYTSLSLVFYMYVEWMRIGVGIFIFLAHQM